MYKELLLGCGSQRQKILTPPVYNVYTNDTVGFGTWNDLTTLDHNPDHKPDIVYELNNVYWDFDPADSYDEIHAYEVLEHLGFQGHYVNFFRDFTNIWRLLKPNGFLCATVPSRFSPWLWGDPGHRRAILPETLIFLDQTTYTNQVGKTSLSDYRDVYKADFKIISSSDDRGFHSFILQAIKPSRIK